MDLSFSDTIYTSGWLAQSETRRFAELAAVISLAVPAPTEAARPGDNGWPELVRTAQAAGARLFFRHPALGDRRGGRNRRAGGGADLNAVETCPICRADFDRVREIERLGQSLAGAAMLSLAEGAPYSTRQWQRQRGSCHPGGADAGEDRGDCLCPAVLSVRR